ncbi:MAG: GNAT family N-acetyltransferase [Desulfobacterium sp.]|nr:GNAT family N-acetyltransferase [Desulfobacterium sp.]
MKLLPRRDHKLAISRLKDVTINTLFAKSVLEQHVGGTVYVDNSADPRAFYVLHSYGMSLLYGDVSDEFLHAELKDYMLGGNGLRTAGEWLQIFPSELENRIDGILGSRLTLFDSDRSQDDSGGAVVKHTRVNFKLNRGKFDQFKCQIDLTAYRFCDVDKMLYAETNGSVVPNKFWNNASDFALHGVGFALMLEDQAVAVAFSSFMHDEMLELGMETKSDYRRRGFASIISAKLVEYCLERGLEPVWACRRGNHGSYNLAVKLGFEPVACLPYYELLR